MSSRDSHFDVLVLGGGTAGCVLAGRLSEDSSRSVCLVEGGPDYGPYAGGGWPQDLLDARTMPDSHAWGFEDWRAWRARVIGGCSSHNACMVVHGSRSADHSTGQHQPNGRCDRGKDRRHDRKT